MTPSDASVKIERPWRPTACPADPPSQRDMPDPDRRSHRAQPALTSPCCSAPLANYTTRDKYTLDFSQEVDQCSAEAGLVTTATLRSVANDSPFGIGRSPL